MQLMHYAALLYGQFCDDTIWWHYITRSTIYVENLIIVSRMMQLMHYAALLYGQFCDDTISQEVHFMWKIS